MNTEIINLNLIMSYPVKWNMYKILRDFIQNFYDAVQNEQFSERFSYKYENETLEIKCSNVSYNYEYLLHIGASSKTNNKDKVFSGYFGEGFKIAALCGIRDYSLEIETSSSNWKIKVIENNIKIDNNDAKTLAYKVERYDEKYSDTTLVIKNLKKQYYDVFHCALESFYYEKNPLFGKKLFGNYYCAIYKRSNIEKKIGYPESYRAYGEGIIFAAFQARGSLKEPLIFCYHKYTENDRERNFFSNIDNIDIIIKCIREIDSETAMKLLIIYKKLWYCYPKHTYGYDSYYTVIKNLIFIMSYNEEIVNKFKTLYPKLLYAKKLEAGDKRSLNNRKYCAEWIKNNPEYILVQDSFKYLGIQSLEEKCEEENILPKVTKPTKVEQKYIRILQNCIKEIFADFFKNGELPECNVIRNLKASVSGYASLTKYEKKEKNIYGYIYRYKIHSICIKEIYLNKENFVSALTVYIHEICHTFGGDKSENFSYAMTDALQIVLYKIRFIEKYQKLWKQID